VSDPNNPADQNDGRLQIGSNNDIVGTAIADNIIFGSNSETDTCKFNEATGAVVPGTVCHTVVTPLPAGTFPLVAAWPPGPLGAVPVNNCVNAALSITVGNGGAASPVPGCYKDVFVGLGGTLNLSAGSYVFKSLTLKAGAILNGNNATVNVQGHTNTEAATINDVTIQTPGTVAQTVTEFIIIGNGSTLSNVVLYAPTSAIHLHLGTTGTNVEAVANFVTVEPVILKNTPVNDCGCFSGVTDKVNSIAIDGGSNLTAVQDFFLSNSCDVTPCTAPGCVKVPAAQVTVVDDKTATIDTTGLPAGNYGHVVGQWNTGVYCNNTPVTVP
jgi:hypothetical protein